MMFYNLELKRNNIVVKVLDMVSQGLKFCWDAASNKISK